MGKRRRGKRRQRQPTTSTAAATEAAAAAVQPNLHENMDEVHLHDQGKVVFVDTKIKSAKFTPLSLVMNNGGPDPPEENNSDSDEAGEDDENYREDPREDFSDMETSNNQQQYINSLEEPDSSDSDFCSSSSDEEENIQFFQPSNNFNYATDKPTILHKEGDCFGVDYLKTRAERKAKERQHRFEIEAWQEQRRHQGKWRWCWEGEDDEFDDVDFLDYQESIKRRTLMTNVVIFFVSFFVCTAILEHQMHFLSGRSSSSSVKHNTATSLHHDSNGMNASSRWGHRFDDDALDGDDIVFDTNFGNNPKYHSHNRHHNDNLSPEEEMEDLEKWEEYEMDTANVLANSAQGWDIHSKSGGLEQDSDKEREDDENDHWVQYFDKSSQQYYYFHKETNATTWTKPDIVKGVILLGVTRSGTEYIVEEFKDDEDSDVEVAGDTSDEAIVEEEEAEESDASTLALSNFEPQTILEHYSDTYWRWNHPYRIPERTEIWGGIDTPVFWHIPNSGTTTAEEIFEHCYHMVIAGTTGSSNDGKIVKQRNVTDVSRKKVVFESLFKLCSVLTKPFTFPKHLSVYTLEDGSHYLNIDLRTPHGISLARTAGLGQSGVADVILTRYIFNAADLFRDTGKSKTIHIDVIVETTSNTKYVYDYVYDCAFFDDG